MTFGSLFAGIGGMDLGFERAGLKCVWEVEKEPYALQVLQTRFPDASRYRDVRYFLGSKRWRAVRSAWAVDCICGGFPCQDISNAGKRVGIEGTRSGLWSEFARVVRLLRPRFVVVENVRALLRKGIRIVNTAKKLVIYHGGCHDGFCAAWLFWKAYPDAEFVAANYGEPPPDVTGSDVYIVDFSYKRDVMSRIIASAMEPHA